MAALVMSLAACGSGPDAAPSPAPSGSSTGSTPSTPSTGAGATPAPSPSGTPSATSTVPSLAVLAGRRAIGAVEAAVPVSISALPDGRWAVRLALTSGGDARLVVSADTSQILSGPDDLAPSDAEQLAEQTLLDAARLDFEEAGARVSAEAPWTTLQELALTQDSAATLWAARLSRVDQVVRRVRVRPGRPGRARRTRRVVASGASGASGGRRTPRRRQRCGRLPRGAHAGPGLTSPTYPGAMRPTSPARTRSLVGLLLVLSSPALVGCGGPQTAGTEGRSTRSPSPGTAVTSPPARPRPSGSALARAGVLATRSVRGSRVLAVRLERSGTQYDVTVAAADGAGRQVQLDAAGRRILSGPRDRHQGAPVRARNRVLLAGARLRFARAAARVVLDVPGTLSGLALDTFRGRVVWDAEVIRGGRTFAVRLDAATGRVLARATLSAADDDAGA